MSKRISITERFELVSIALLYPVKGFEDAINAIDIVRKTIPHVHLNIIGTGPLFNELETLINNKNLGDNISLLGHLPHNEIISYLQKAHIYLLTSISEGFSLSFLEAISCGLPAISTAVGVATSVISEYENGVLIPIHNPEAIAHEIINMYSFEKIEEYSQKSVNASKSFSWETVAIQYLDLFEQILLKHDE